MSRMRTYGKPPLAKSPVRLRPRRVIRSDATASLQTPPGSLTKSQKRLNPTWSEEDTGMLRPEYQNISYELRALAKMVNDEIGNGESAVMHSVVDVKSTIRSNSSSFERGRLYEEYSARRSERLNSKRRCGNSNKKSSEALRELKTPSYKAGLGVTVESSKKGRESKVAESFRKSMSAAYCSSALKGTPTAAAATSAAASSTPRYMLRSMSKENRKPATTATAIPFPSGVRRTRRI